MLFPHISNIFSTFYFTNRSRKRTRIIRRSNFAPKGFRRIGLRGSKGPIGQNLLKLIFCLTGWAMFSILKFFYTLVYDKLTLLWKKKFRQLKVNLFTIQNSHKSVRMILTHGDLSSTRKDLLGHLKLYV